MLTVRHAKEGYNVSLDKIPARACSPREQQDMSRPANSLNELRSTCNHKPRIQKIPFLAVNQFVPCGGKRIVALLNAFL